MSIGARVRILGVAWKVVEAQSKWHSPLVVRKRRRKGRDGKWKKNGRERKDGGGCFLLLFFYLS